MSLEEYVCLKDHSWKIAEISLVLGAESLKYIHIHKQASTYNTSCLRGFQEEKKSSALIQTQTPAYSAARHYWNFKQDQYLWSGNKKSVLADRCHHGILSKQIKINK